MFIGSKSFQEKLVYVLLTTEDKDFQLQFAELITANYFELYYLVALIKLSLKYYKKYYDIPSADHVLTILDKEIDPTLEETKSTNEAVRDFLNKYNSKNISISERNDIKQKALDFIQKQQFKQVIIDAFEYVQDLSFDFETAKERFIKKLIETDNAITDLDLIKDFDRYINVPRFPITTGLPELDKYLDGGLGIGEIGMLIGGPSTGKSHGLIGRIAEARKIFKEDNDCAVYFTCELADHAVQTRTASYHSKIPFNILKKDKSSQEKTKEILRQFKGTIKCQEYPSGTATVSMFRNYLERLRAKNYNIKMIAVDYPEEMAINVSSTRLSIAQIYRQLRALGHKKSFNCPVWVASQANRDTFEDDVITLRGLAEAFAKGMIVDVALSISDEKLVLLKNRVAGKASVVFPIELDTDISYFKITGKAIPLKNYLKASDQFDQKKFDTALRKRFSELHGGDKNGNGDKKEEVN